MANLLRNAGFLELTEGWAATADAVVNVLEQGGGSPGRAVMRAVLTAAAPGEVLSLAPSVERRVPVQPGQVLEISAGVAAGRRASVTFAGGSAFSSGATFISALGDGVSFCPDVELLFHDAAGDLVAVRPLATRAPGLTLHGHALGGIRSTFWGVFGRETVPAEAVTATLTLSATSTAGDQAVTLLLLKPFVGLLPPGRSDPIGWDPGTHDDPALDLIAWPAVLKPFQASSTSEPRDWLVDFDAGPGRPAQRTTSFEPARRFAGRVRCDPVQREALDAFARARGSADFWFVEPDSDRLCIASFAADGVPRLAESRGPTVMMELALWLETA